MELQDSKQQFLRGTEVGRLECYGFPGETLAGDGIAHQAGMGAGNACHDQQEMHLVVCVRREEESINSVRPVLAAVARTLQVKPLEVELLYLSDSETN